MPREERSHSRSKIPRRSVPSNLSTGTVTACPITSAPSQPQPSLIGKLLDAAGGAAIGSTVGTALGNGITSLFSGVLQKKDAPTTDSTIHQPYPNQPNELTTGPCDLEIKQFLQCAQQQTDLSFCDGFNEALQKCQQFKRMPTDLKL